MKRVAIALAPLAITIHSSLLADTSTAALDDVVVTASRSLMPLNLALDAATVITRSDIERQQATTVADLLSQATGISLPTNGGPLTTTGVFLRGFKSNQVLVLIDGVRANDASSGQFDFSSLRADDIERIEVLRGGYSSQYGSDAMGGVIQIFTRQAAGNSLSLRAGSFGTLEAQLSLHEATGQGRFGVSLSQLETQGFNAGNQNYAAANFQPNDPDRDGGRLRTLRLHGQQALGRSGQLSGSVMLKEQRTEFDNGVSDGNNTIATLAYDRVVSARYQQRLSWGHNRTRLATPAFNSQFDTIRNTFTWLHTLDLAAMGTLTGGISQVDERLQARFTDFTTFSTARLGRALRDQAVFIMAENKVGPLSYRLSGRHEKHEQWGRQSTGSARLGYAVSETVEVFAGYGTNFRAPTANELFGNFGFPNPDLKPEKSRQRDIGLTWRYHAQHRVGITAYRNDVSDLINGFPPVNVASATLEGVELELAGNAARWGYTLGLLKARSVDADGNDLDRRPRTQLNADVYWQHHAKLRIGVQQLARNSTPDVGGRNAGFSVFNAYATWQARPDLSLGLRLDNLTDRDYELAKGFSTPGRSGYVTATYRF